MKKAVFPLILLLAAFVAGMLVGAPKAPSALPTPEHDSIRVLEQRCDSLDALLASRPAVEVYYMTRYRTIRERRDTLLDSVSRLSPTPSVRFFAERVGVDSIGLLPDSSAAVPPQAVLTANRLFIEGEAAEEMIVEQSRHLASKDSTICMQRQRIVAGDSLRSKDLMLYAHDRAVLEQGITKQRKTATIFKAATAVEAVLLILSMLF